MRLTLTEDQTMLAKTATAFVANRSPLSRAHKMRHGRDPLGYSQPIWKEMAELGWTAIPFAEKDGGAGLGMAEVVVVTEALGRCLAPEPFIPSIMLAGQAVALAGNDAQKSAWLERAIAGQAVLALADREAGDRYGQARVTTAAQKTDKGYRLSGQKVHVAGGYQADAYVVTARTSGSAGDAEGVTLFLVPAKTAGLEVTQEHRVDSRNAAVLKMTNMVLPETAVLGQVGGGAKVLDEVTSRAMIALSGEMLGAMSEALERTIAFMKERVQFGVVIGTFQALKHRVARLFVEVELSRSAVMAAARALDEDSEGKAAFVSNAMARCIESYKVVANEAVQIHGGIGMTDEHEIGLFMKHAAVAAITFGDARYHRDCFAKSCGF